MFAWSFKPRASLTYQQHTASAKISCAAALNTVWSYKQATPWALFAFSPQCFLLSQPVSTTPCCRHKQGQLREPIYVTCLQKKTLLDARFLAAYVLAVSNHYTVMLILQHRTHPIAERKTSPMSVKVGPTTCNAQGSSKWRYFQAEDKWTQCFLCCGDSRDNVSHASPVRSSWHIWTTSCQPIKHYCLHATEQTLHEWHDQPVFRWSDHDANLAVKFSPSIAVWWSADTVITLRSNVNALFVQPIGYSPCVTASVKHFL